MNLDLYGPIPLTLTVVPPRFRILGAIPSWSPHGWNSFGKQALTPRHCENASRPEFDLTDPNLGVKDFFRLRASCQRHASVIEVVTCKPFLVGDPRDHPRGLINVRCSIGLALACGFSLCVLCLAGCSEPVPATPTIEGKTPAEFREDMDKKISRPLGDPPAPVPKGKIQRR